MSRVIFEKRENTSIIPVDPFLEHEYQYIFYVTKGNDLLILERFNICNKYGFRSLKFTVEWITNYNQRPNRAVKYTFKSDSRNKSIELALQNRRKVYGANYSNEMLELYSKIVSERLER